MASSFDVRSTTGVLIFSEAEMAFAVRFQQSTGEDTENTGNGYPPEIAPRSSMRSPSAPVVAEPVLGPSLCASTMSMGSSIMYAMLSDSSISAKPGKLVAVTAYFPAAENPLIHWSVLISSGAGNIMGNRRLE